jgi:hypothetical protein
VTASTFKKYRVCFRRRYVRLIRRLPVLRRARTSAIAVLTSKKFEDFEPAFWT